MTEIHYSEIAKYLKCKKEHEYYYIKGVEPRYFNSQMSFGTFGHKAMETLLHTGDEVKAKEEVDKLWLQTDSQIQNDKIRENNRIVANDAVTVAVRAYKYLDGRFETVVHKEHGKLIEVPIKYTEELNELNHYDEVDGIERISYKGTLDWVAIDKRDGGIWIIDHKFRKLFREPESEQYNLQMFMYLRFLERVLGITATGTRQFQIKSIAPKDPEILKDGKVSKKDIMTDWDHYKRFLEKHQENPDAYISMKEKLDAHVWFDIDSTKTYRSPEAINAVWDEVVIPISKEIISRSHPPTRTLDYMMCRMCSMENLCMEDLNGGDTDFLMKTKYKLKGESNTIDITVEDD